MALLTGGFLGSLFGLGVAAVLFKYLRHRHAMSFSTTMGGDTDLLIFVANDEPNNHVVMKNIDDLYNHIAMTTLEALEYPDEASRGRMRLVPATQAEQRDAVTLSCPDGIERFNTLVQNKQEHLARELWKYCVLSQSDGSAARLFVDASSPLLLTVSDLLVFARRKSNLAVLGEEYLPKTIHGSLMLVQPNQGQVPSKMLSSLIETPLDQLTLDPVLLPRMLYEMIAQDAKQPSVILGHNGDWYILEEICFMDPLRRSDDALSSDNSETYRLNHACPQATGFCCAVRNGLDTTVLMTRHPIYPYQTLSTQIPRPYNAEAGHFAENELPFIATIRERVFSKPDNFPPTPNFFDILLQNDCLPDGAVCSKCLREKNGATRQSCAKACPCYSKALCREEAGKKFVAKEVTVVPPLYARDPDRLVPRIIHQTYFEELTKDKYPNMSRLVESFKHSGWDYRFYSDEDAQNFLSTHFPKEVREAYDAIRPGAFKADLFRYCALLIHGGVYADVDIMLESSLDNSIPGNVGFVVPVDEPGIEAKRPCCVWNGLIASSPGHPILAQAIETVVNQVRNRFTSVDVDSTFCPDPELSVLHAFDILYTAGPCLLGAAINKVMGRPLQEPFVAGEMIASEKNTNAAKIPGKTIILHQNKWDMGSHRFTYLEKNLVVAATDLEDSNDRDNQPSTGKTEHYSKTHKAVGIYGLENLYKDRVQANEDIVFKIGLQGGHVGAAAVQQK